MALDESYVDRQSFFDQEALYDGQSILGNFSNETREAPFGAVGVVGRGPSFLCEASDVDPDPAGHTLVFDDTTYTVIRGEPDGTGMTRLILEAV